MRSGREWSPASAQISTAPRSGDRQFGKHAFLGLLIVLVDGKCASACDYFSHTLQKPGRVGIVGEYNRSVSAAGSTELAEVFAAVAVITQRPLGFSVARRENAPPNFRGG